MFDTATRRFSRPRSRPRNCRSTLRHLDALESRLLLTTTVTGYSPDSFLAPSGAYAPNGQAWFANLGTGSSLDRVVNGVVVESIALPDTTPLNLTIAPRGSSFVFFFIDANTGTLDEVDPSNPVIVSHPLTGHPAYSPVALGFSNTLAATDDGSLWFIAQDTSDFSANIIGHLDASGAITYANVTAAPNAQAVSLSANTSNSIYVGYEAVESAGGHNYVGSATYIAGGISTATYDVNVSDSDATTYGTLTGVTTADNGDVWFSLANSGFTATQSTDRLVHGVISGATLTQTRFTVQGSGPDAGVFVNHPTFDGNGKLWFIETNGNQIGYLDTHAANAITTFALPDNDGEPTVGPESLIVSQDSSVLDVYTTTESAGYSLVQVHTDAPTVTFSGSANDQVGAENHALTGILVATFTAPAGTYSASVAWGDSTTSAGTIVDLGGNTYAVMVSSKTFASQGVYNGTVTVKNSANTAVGTLAFHSTISDTPLAITSYAVNSLVLRLAVTTLTFTDDINSSASWFTTTIHWGDNSTSSGLVVRDPFNAGRYMVIAVHQYRRRGTYSVSTSVTTSEAGASPVTATASANVTV